MNTNDNKVYTLRINTRLLEKLKELAKESKRSAAKEIELRLEQSLNSTLTIE